MEVTLTLFVVVAISALLFEYMSVSFGMGYGTTLTPLLLIIGFSALEAVPAVLLSQLVGGVIGGLAHHRFGNIKLDFRQDKDIKGRLRGLGYIPRSLDSKIILILVICGVIGVLVGVFAAINIPRIVLEAYIGAIVLGIGIVILIRGDRKSTFSWKGLVVVGLLGSFNKGMSGGGYVPLVTGGQIISGREARSSIGSTTVAVALVCAVGFLSYLLIKGDIYWMLAAATSTGSVIAAPFAAMTVRKVSTNKLQLAIGIVTSVLGALTLAKTFIL